MLFRVVLFTAWVLSIMLLTRGVGAQQLDNDRLVLNLARAAVAECGWRHTDCHSATFFTLQRRWKKTQVRYPEYEPLAMVLRYCSVFKVIKPHTTWIRMLPVPGHGKPHGWPDKKAKWEIHASKWASIYAHAGAFLRGETKDRCKGKPIHFGAGIEVSRFNQDIWRFVNCGSTGGQRFLARR